MYVTITLFLVDGSFPVCHLSLICASIWICFRKAFPLIYWSCVVGSHSSCDSKVSNLVPEHHKLVHHLNASITIFARLSKLSTFYFEISKLVSVYLFAITYFHFGNN